MPAFGGEKLFFFFFFFPAGSYGHKNGKAGIPAIAGTLASLLLDLGLGPMKKGQCKPHTFLYGFILLKDTDTHGTSQSHDTVP